MFREALELLLSPPCSHCKPPTWSLERLVCNLLSLQRLTDLCRTSGKCEGIRDWKVRLWVHAITQGELRPIPRLVQCVFVIRDLGAIVQCTSSDGPLGIPTRGRLGVSQLMKSQIMAIAKEPGNLTAGVAVGLGQWTVYWPGELWRAWRGARFSANLIGNPSVRLPSLARLCLRVSRIRA